MKDRFPDLTIVDASRILLQAFPAVVMVVVLLPLLSEVVVVPFLVPPHKVHLSVHCFCSKQLHIHFSLKMPDLSARVHQLGQEN